MRGNPRRRGDQSSRASASAHPTDRDVLTSDQHDFSKALGRLLAELWEREQRRAFEPRDEQTQRE